ncbi:MAG: hypothetical protein C0623_08235 [Desulfuromonas sp.]|nr:MAG: hypothetical protein C0623_08235 [Desulfuromonas sp.]
MNKNDTKTAKLREIWILCFLLGVVMLNYPFLHIFNKTTFYFGIPILILYFFIGWPISIGVIYLFSRIIEAPEHDRKSSGRDES